MSSDDKISKFQLVTGGEPKEIAVYFLEENNWSLEKAVHMFFWYLEHDIQTPILKADDSKRTGWETSEARGSNSQASGEGSFDEVQSLSLEDNEDMQDDLEDTTLSVASEPESKPEEPFLNEEPKDSKEHVCKIAIHFPDGRRL